MLSKLAHIQVFRRTHLLSQRFMSDEPGKNRTLFGKGGASKQRKQSFLGQKLKQMKEKEETSTEEANE